MIGFIGYMSFLLLIALCLIGMFIANILFLINFVYPYNILAGVFISFVCSLCWLSIIGVLAVSIEKL